MIVKLSKAEVKVKDSLTWGDAQKIQGALMSGAKMSGKSSNVKEMGFDFDASAMLESKYVSLECTILEINENGKTIQFSRDWMDGLSIEDGDKLYSAVDEIAKKK